MNNRFYMFKRRDFLKSLATVPVLGALAYGTYRKQRHEIFKEKEILDELNLYHEKSLQESKEPYTPGDHLRIGVIGLGARGPQLLKGLGFVHPDWLKKYEGTPQLDNFMAQDNLNVSVTGICDIFDLHAQKGLDIAANDIRPGGGQGKTKQAKRYAHYRELLESDDIDAVIVATPDHWHAQMTIDALKAGKHVYCEKCMTRTEEEAHRTKETANNNKHVILQVGHQNRQQETYKMAKDIINRNVLGKISVVETYTNRNTQWGAWIRHHGKPGSPATIDWEQFLGPAPKVPFSLDRYYNWTKYWDYATGLSGQLFSHEFDAVNQIMDIGIPHAATAMGGIYYYKDGREIPDVFQVVFEYPDKEMTLTYSATLLNGKHRPRLFLGKDATMEISRSINVTADPNSEKYEKLLQQGKLPPSKNLLTYNPGSEQIDASTSATEQYFASRGLTYTYRQGKIVDTVHLHLRDWLEAIRNNRKPDCDIQKGFEEAIACHMATKAYREQRRVVWDEETNRIV